jgi:hypothetical protein
MGHSLRDGDNTCNEFETVTVDIIAVEGLTQTDAKEGSSADGDTSGGKRVGADRKSLSMLFD